MTSKPHDEYGDVGARWASRILRDAETMQQHKQDALLELTDKHLMRMAEFVHQRLSHGVSIKTVIDELVEAAVILEHHNPKHGDNK